MLKRLGLLSLIILSVLYSVYWFAIAAQLLAFVKDTPNQIAPSLKAQSQIALDYESVKVRGFPFSFTLIFEKPTATYASHYNVQAYTLSSETDLLTLALSPTFTKAELFLPTRTQIHTRYVRDENSYHLFYKNRPSLRLGLSMAAIFYQKPVESWLTSLNYRDNGLEIAENDSISQITTHKAARFALTQSFEPRFNTLDIKAEVKDLSIKTNVPSLIGRDKGISPRVLNSLNETQKALGNQQIEADYSFHYAPQKAAYGYDIRTLSLENEQFLLALSGKAEKGENDASLLKNLYLSIKHPEEALGYAASVVNLITFNQSQGGLISREMLDKTVTFLKAVDQKEENDEDRVTLHIAQPKNGTPSVNGIPFFELVTKLLSR